MWRTQISLFCILLFIILLEATIIPSLWSSLRIDFLIGLTMGLVIYAPFAPGFTFVLVTTLLLQALTGARLGFFPLVYVVMYLFLDLVKNLIFLENFVVQAISGFVLSIGIALIFSVMLDMNFTRTGTLGIFISALFTGVVTPLMVFIVLRMQVSNGT